MSPMFITPVWIYPSPDDCGQICPRSDMSTAKEGIDELKGKRPAADTKEADQDVEADTGKNRSQTCCGRSHPRICSVYLA